MAVPTPPDPITPESSPLTRLLPLLRCPVCAAAGAGSGLTATPTGVVCAHGHSFDRARQGHLTLFGPRGRRFPGDTPGQVASRERFLAGGWYAPVADAVVTALAEGLSASSSTDSLPDPSATPSTLSTPSPHATPSPHPTPVVAEFGAGTGYYLARAVDGLRERSGRVLGLGAEISAPAARRLARAHHDVAAVVCDTWETLPIADTAVDALCVVFAPRNPTEFARILAPGGVAVVAVPGEGHLEPLRAGLGMLGAEPGKDARLADDFAGWEPVTEITVDRTLALPRAAARDLALMGPSGVHLEAADLEAALDRVVDDEVVPTRLHVRVKVYRRPSE